MHSIYRRYFNSVDVHNKLTVGPGSMARMLVKNFRARVVMALIAMCATNAVLCYTRYWEKNSLEYANADFKFELIEELLQGTDRLRGVVEVPAEERASPGQAVPDCFAGHGWAPSDPDRAQVRQCAVYKERAFNVCLCGEFICGSKSGRQCIFQHMHDVLQQGPGTIDPNAGKKRRRTR